MSALEFGTDHAPDEPRQQWQWWCRNELGGVHIWASKHTYKDGFVEYMGGVEVHYATPPEHADYCGHHDDCWLLKGPCWHDGSSLWFRENLADQMLRFGPDAMQERIYGELRYWHRSKFGDQS